MPTDAGSFWLHSDVDRMIEDRQQDVVAKHFIITSAEEVRYFRSLEETDFKFLLEAKNKRALNEQVLNPATKWAAVVKYLA